MQFPPGFIRRHIIIEAHEIGKIMIWELLMINQHLNI